MRVSGKAYKLKSDWSQMGFQDWIKSRWFNEQAQAPVSGEKVWYAQVWVAYVSSTRMNTCTKHALLLPSMMEEPNREYLYKKNF